MRFSFMFITLSVLFAGCDQRKSDDAAPAAPAAPAASAASAAAPASAAPAQSATPSAATLPARSTPEDLDVNPARDPRVRARARELNAIDVAEMRNLKVGDEVVVLVRADRGGGTIYGSGPYTLDSQIRKAVIHAGALKDRELGIVRVKVIRHDAEHPSVPANGIVPTAWGKYHQSYTIEPIPVP